MPRKGKIRSYIKLCLQVQRQSPKCHHPLWLHPVVGQWWSRSSCDTKAKQGTGLVAAAQCCAIAVIKAKPAIRHQQSLEVKGTGHQTLLSMQDSGSATCPQPLVLMLLLLASLKNLCQTQPSCSFLGLRSSLLFHSNMH